MSARRQWKAVATLDAPGAASQFSQRQDAQEELLRLALLDPGADKRARTLALAELGDHMGIDEVFHSSTTRGRERGWSKSASSPTAGIARR